MKFNFDPSYLEVLPKAEFDQRAFLGRHWLAVLSGDGWVRALRQKHQTMRRAREWGDKCVKRLMARYASQHREPTA